MGLVGHTQPRTGGAMTAPPAAVKLQAQGSVQNGTTLLGAAARQAAVNA